MQLADAGLMRATDLRGAALGVVRPTTPSWPPSVLKRLPTPDHGTRLYLGQPTRAMGLFTLRD